MLVHRGDSQANPYTTLLMKVRAYLAKDEDQLVPKKDSGRHIDIDTSTEDPDHIKQLCSIIFGNDIKFLNHFERPAGLEEYLKDEDIIYRRYDWQGPGIYLLWLPERHRMIYRSDILLQRELRFKLDLEEHLERNSEGDIDRTLMEL